MDMLWGLPITARACFCSRQLNTETAAFYENRTETDRQLQNENRSITIAILTAVFAAGVYSYCYVLFDFSQVEIGSNEWSLWFYLIGLVWWGKLMYICCISEVSRWMSDVAHVAMKTAEMMGFNC